jgi:preprotein translocase subunit SecA
VNLTKTIHYFRWSKAIWIILGVLQVKEITWDMIHYDVQLIGGMVLHEGKSCEMQTVKEKH